jgi:hypothetical protein
MQSNSPDRPLDQVRAELFDLHRAIGALATDALRLRPGVKLMLRRTPLRNLENQLNAYRQAFMNIDADLVMYANPSASVASDINAIVKHAGTYQMYFGIRDSVRGVLETTQGTLSSVRNDLAFRQSLYMSVAALLVAFVSLYFDFAGFIHDA